MTDRKAREWTARLRTMDVIVRVAEGEDGQPVSLSAAFGPPGNALAVAVDAMCAAATINLKHGLGVEHVVHAWLGQRFEPAGETGDELAPLCLSVSDYLARSILARYGTPVPLVVEQDR